MHPCGDAVHVARDVLGRALIMLARAHFLWLGSLAILATIAACSLNPQPEPPMADPTGTHDAAVGGSGGNGQGGAGQGGSGKGGASIGGSSGAAGGWTGGSGGSKPIDGGGSGDADNGGDGACYDCNCPCANADADGGCEGGVWDAGPDAMCPCEGGTDADSAEDVVTPD
jgi:hypothetical protein